MSDKSIPENAKVETAELDESALENVAGGAPMGDPRMHFDESHVNITKP